MIWVELISMQGCENPEMFISHWLICLMSIIYLSNLLNHLNRAVVQVGRGFTWYYPIKNIIRLCCQRWVLPRIFIKWKIKSLEFRAKGGLMTFLTLWYMIGTAGVSALLNYHLGNVVYDKNTQTFWEILSLEERGLDTWPQAASSYFSTTVSLPFTPS